MAELRRHFRPEFLNRVDDIVLFKPLTEPEIERIVELLFNDLRARLAERQITLEITDEAPASHRPGGLRPGLRRPPSAPVHRPRSRDPDRAGPAFGRDPRRQHHQGHQTRRSAPGHLPEPTRRRPSGGLIGGVRPWAAVFRSSWSRWTDQNFARTALVAAQELSNRVQADVYILSVVARPDQVADIEAELTALPLPDRIADIAVVIGDAPARVINQTLHDLGTAALCMATHARGLHPFGLGSMGTPGPGRGAAPVILVGPSLGYPEGTPWVDEPIHLEKFRGGGVVVCVDGGERSASWRPRLGPGPEC